MAEDWAPADHEHIKNKAAKATLHNRCINIKPQKGRKATRRKENTNCPWQVVIFYFCGAVEPAVFL
jgi:hypothetical protein